MSGIASDQLLGAARLAVRAKAPYFSALLLALVPTPMPGLGTIAVTKNALLLIDDEWLQKFTAPQVAGLLVHELGHVMHEHMKRVGQRDARLWNCAGDLAINPAVVEMGFELPGGEDSGLFPKKFGFPEGLTADEYYDLLQKEQEKQSQKGGGQGEPDQDHVGSGACGSCAGNPNEQEPKDGSAEQKDGRSPAEISRALRTTAESIRDHASKKRGSVPSSLERWADFVSAPPKVPWRQKLQTIVRAACAYRAGAVITRYDAPSRRQSALGFGMGCPVLPRPRQPVPRVALAIDTSGSMGPEELGISVIETKGVLKAVGAEIDFIACDAEVGAIGTVSKVSDLAKLLKGGGGTSFVPVFEAVKHMRSRPEILIFATDGCGPAPEAPPPGLKVIWLLVGRYQQRPYAEGTGKPIEWGEFLVIDDVNEKA